MLADCLNRPIILKKTSAHVRIHRFDCHVNQMNVNKLFNRVVLYRSFQMLQTGGITKWRNTPQHKANQQWCSQFHVTKHLSMSNNFLSVNGRWSKWAAWSKCSRTCGQGKQTRNRTCTNPPPKYGGTCVGPATQTKSCLVKKCPGLWNLKCFLNYSLFI